MRADKYQNDYSVKNINLNPVKIQIMINVTVDYIITLLIRHTYTNAKRAAFPHA